MEEWWISTVGVQKWCPQPRPWQSLRPQSKLMQSTAVLNFAKSKNMGKKKEACIPFLAGFSFACSPPGSLPFAFQWLLQQGGMENISHLHFSQTFNSAVVGGHMQKERLDFSLSGSGRNRLQISLWKPPEYGCCPQGHWAVFSLDRGYGAAQTAQRHRGTHLSHSHTSLQLGICPHMFITYRAYTTQFNFVDYSSSLFVDSSTQLIQEWVFVKARPGARWRNATKIEFCSLQLLPKVPSYQWKWERSAKVTHPTPARDGGSWDTGWTL